MTAKPKPKPDTTKRGPGRVRCKVDGCKRNAAGTSGRCTIHGGRK